MNIRIELLQKLRFLLIISLYTGGLMLSWAVILGIGTFVLSEILPDATLLQLALWTAAVISLLWMSALAFFCWNNRSNQQDAESEPVAVGKVMVFYRSSGDPDPAAIGEVVRIMPGLVCPEDIGVELVPVGSEWSERITARRIQGKWYLGQDLEAICGPVESVMPYPLA